MTPNAGASPRCDLDNRSIIARIRSGAHRTFAGDTVAEHRDMPTDWINTSEWRRRANSKVVASRAVEQALGCTWKELDTGRPWTAVAANQIDTRCEPMRHVQAILPPGNTAKERKENADKLKLRPVREPKGLEAYKVRPISRFAVAHEDFPRKASFRQACLPVGVSIKNSHPWRRPSYLP